MAGWTSVRREQFFFIMNDESLTSETVFANAGIVEKFEFYKRHKSDSHGLPPRLDSTVIDVNLQSVVTTTYLAIHFFRKNSKPGGVLVMTASSGGLYPVPYLPMYAGAKHGVVGFMRSIEGVLSKEDIKAHCICPAAVRTNLIAKEEWDKMPQNTFVPIEKVVEAVQMLVDNERLHGKTVELIQDRWSFRDGPVLDDPAMTEIMNMSETPFDREKQGIAT
jgi:short-subunit dehydrogenase